jgi:PEP-CTERM putative exosortase interaction domain/autotransporter-associated beta strand repeat
MKTKVPVFRLWKILAAGAVCGALGLGMPSTMAFDYTWIAGGATSYTTPTAWNPSGPPDASDNIIWNDAGGAGDMAINITGEVPVANVFMSVSSGQRTTRISGNFAPIFTVSGTISKTGGSAYSIMGRNDGSGTNEMTVHVGHVDLQEGILNFGSLAVGSTSFSAALRAVTIGSATLADGATMGFAVGRNATTGTATITGNLHMEGASTVNLRNRAGTGAGQSTILQVGSLSSAGSGAVIQANDLTAGNPTTGLLRLNNAAGVSVFAGVIRDGGTIGNMLSVEKNNNGTQVLTGANTYTGATTINAGTLLVGQGGTGSLGNTAVTVNAGTLGGTGSVAGTVVIGDGAGAGDAFLSAGDGAGLIGTFTIGNSLSLNADATFVFEYNSTLALADQVAANGITISGASISIIDLTPGGILAEGTEFVVINNTSGGAIVGTFSNLADGSTISVGDTLFQVSYSGGDGNDLVLTVVPEPATTMLFGLGLASVLFFRRRLG